MPEQAEIRAALAANERFYEAFAAGDYEGMDALWATTVPVLCVHPGSPAIHGRDPVMASWAEILDKPPPIEASSAQVAVVRGLAVVTCLEHLGPVTLAATNLFAWEDGAWRLVHHQAGALHQLDPESAPPDGHLH